MSMATRAPFLVEFYLTNLLDAEVFLIYHAAPTSCAHTPPTSESNVSYSMLAFAVVFKEGANIFAWSISVCYCMRQAHIDGTLLHLPFVRRPCWTTFGQVGWCIRKWSQNTTTPNPRCPRSPGARSSPNGRATGAACYTTTPNPRCPRSPEARSWERVSKPHP